MGSKLSMSGAALLLAGVLFSCGDDDDGSASRCPADDSESVSCRCDDGSQGRAPCGADGSVGQCECVGDGGTSGRGGTGASGSGSGGTSAGGSGGTSAGGSGGTSAGGSGGTSAGGSGGSGGSDPEQDGGQEPRPDAGGDPDPTPDPRPMDGNQLAACERDRDCNMNLGCYGAGEGGFCTRECENDDDCASLQGAAYSCGNSGLCIVACANVDDDASCPAGLECVAIGGGGGGGGDAFRCLYPEGDEPGGGGFAECNGGGDCADGLQCVGESQQTSGFCSHGCTPEDQDCSDVPAPSGSITASCVPQGPEQGVCALDCKAMPTGCPTGMECVTQGFYSLCRYAD